MSKTRKVLALALALVMSCTMAACGGDSETTDGGSTSTSADGTYKIGMIYPMSGGNALFGNAMVSAPEIAVDMIYEAGGVNGTQIQLVVGDGATSSEASTEATRMIDSEGVNVIIGSMSSGNANAIRSVTERSNVILWETSAVADNVLDGNSGLTFRICDQGSYRGYNAVKFLCEELADDLGKEPSELKIAVINEDSSYGESIAEGAVEAAEEFGVTVAYNEAYDAASTDVSSTVMGIQSAGVDALVAASYINDALLFYDTLTQYDAWPDVLLGCGSGWNDPTIRDTIGADGVEGIFCVDMPSNIELSMLNEENAALLGQFRETYTAETGSEAPLTACVAFMGAYVFLKDILPCAASFSTEDIAAAIQAADIEQTTMIWSLQFDESGQNTGAQSVLMQWQGGELKTVWPAAYANGTYANVPLNK